ncbi:MAG: 2-hydroxyacid dehydrogenase [Gemmatimonadales bacterium]
MRLAVFDAHSYDREAFQAANGRYGHELVFFEPRLDCHTAVVARGFPAVCSFVNDRLDADTLAQLKDVGVRLVALRSTGFNHVDLEAARRLDLTVVRVPEYSPHAVAEHAFGLLLALIRKIPRAAARVREANFALDGLVGVDLYGKTLGLVGTGRIGAAAARIAAGFGCRVLAHDPRPDDALAGETGLQYVALDELFQAADVISLHVPLTRATRHIVDEAAFGRMKPGVVLINTSRGALIDTRALITALKSGRIGAAGLDVYEEEEGLFFQDHSDEVLQDDVLARLLTFPNVLITAHQGFLTREALANIATTTLGSLTAFERGERLIHEVRASGPP